MLAARLKFQPDSAAKAASRLGVAIRRRALAGAVAALAVCAGAPHASAQLAFFGPDGFFDEPMPRIPPRGIVYRLQDRGYSEISRPRFDGAAYIVEATQPNGARVRLFVDARDGVMLGRQRLGPAAPARVARAPGFGWTEDDAPRGAEGLVPPADIPSAGPSGKEARLGSDPQLRPGSLDAVPEGLNPDAKGRPNPAQRKAARLSQPQKPAPAPIAPDAPTPKPDVSGGTGTPATSDARPRQNKPETAKIETPKPDAAGSDTARPETAKAESPKEAAAPPHTPAASSSPVTPAANQTPAAEKPREQAWQERSAEGPKRNVRIIDGATIVPGSGEAAPSTN